MFADFPIVCVDLYVCPHNVVKPLCVCLLKCVNLKKEHLIQ